MSSTINDVAKEAGVSITTVSRVLNNNYPVKKETREKVEKAIEKLNFKPNVAARSLITKKSSTIAVLVPGLTNLFFPEIVETIEETIKNSGYNTILSNTYGDSEEEKNIVEDIMARQIDGLIIIDPTVKNLENGYFDKISSLMPLIIVSGICSDYAFSSVSYDEEVGTKSAFEYLIKLGHKNIVFVRGHKSFSYDIKEKIYKNIIEEYGFEYKKIINVGRGNNMEVVDKTAHEFKNFISKGEKPTAVFACNDLMAVGILNACRELGIEVPKEISVIGCDNTLISEVTHPKLTTIDLNKKQIGKRAAAEIIDIVQNKGAARRKIILNTSLIVRESCGKIE